MFKEGGQSSRQNAKRKRRSSENSPITNDENIPMNEDKKLKVESKACDQAEASTSANIDVECERLPLSELSLFDRQSSAKHSQHSDSDNDDSLDDLICCEEDRLSIPECDSGPLSNVSSLAEISSPIAQELSDVEDENNEEEVDYDSLEIEDEAFFDECLLEQKEFSEADACEPSTSGSQPLCYQSDNNSYGQLSPVSNPTCTPSSLSSKKAPKARKRLVSLPHLEWADAKELWKTMVTKDETSLNTRHPDMFSNHPGLQPRMRSVLLDWVIEVCEVYKLHRETYYLAMDYIDRYLSLKADIHKQQLQLIGVSCLFIAAKMEEIYPPKVTEFAYVTDGACTDDEILQQELIILKTLNWELSPMSINNWLTTYVQLCYKDETRFNTDFVYSQFSGQLFTRLAELLDLATLDLGSLKFSYSILAAACLYLACSKRLALEVSGFSEVEIKPCVEWMRHFWEALKEESPEQKRSSQKQILPPGPSKKTYLDESHSFQVHTVSLELLEAGQYRLEASEALILTPPRSSQKVNISS